MINALIVIAAVILLGALLFFEKKEHNIGKLLTKTPLSVLFVLAAFVQPRPQEWYFNLIFAGLILCLAGDVFLVFSSSKTFLVGLVSFLLGHVLYVSAFVVATHLKTWLSWPALVVLAAGAAIFLFYLRPHLGEMFKPVLAYIVVISLMVIGALAVFLTPEIPRRGALMVLLGALLFYLSDIFVARDRFVSPGYVNRRFGLPMYYAGQFLLAFSVGQLA
ncbi:MAG: lysoplasmalogenase [Pseudomonadota bacterium]